MLSRCFLDFSVGVGAFVIGLSQISFFFSFKFLELAISLLDFSPRIPLGTFSILLNKFLKIFFEFQRLNFEFQGIIFELQ